MYKYFFAFIIIVQTILFPQQSLTIEDAIRIGLENNYEIKIALNNSAIESNNVTPGNAGFLPLLDITGSRSFSTNDTKQEYASGEIIDRTNVESNNINAAASLNWTVFDGLNMFISYSRLKELNLIGEIEAKTAIENNIALISQMYFEITSIDKTIEAIQEAMIISEERVRIAEDKLNLGSGSKLELLQAQVDLNSDKAALLRKQILLSNAKIQLNRLLGRDESISFNVVDTIVVKTDLSYEGLKEAMLKVNSSLISAELNRNVSSLNLQSIKSQWFPRIGIFVNYSYAKSENQVGFFRSNQNLGLTYGLNLSLNLFDGLNTKRQIENARLSLINSELQMNNIKSQITSAFEQQFINYSNGLKLINLEEENLEVAKENVEIAIERYKFGTYTPLELREAQTALLNAQSRLAAAKFTAKEAEIELLRLSGEIIKR